MVFFQGSAGPLYPWHALRPDDLRRRSLWSRQSSHMAELLAVDCADAVYIARLRTYLATLVLGLDRARDLLVGYRLANRNDPKDVPKPGPHPSDLDEDLVVSIWDVIESGADYPTFPVQVWERCTRLKGLAGERAASS